MAVLQNIKHVELFYPIVILIVSLIVFYLSCLTEFV